MMPAKQAFVVALGLGALAFSAFVWPTAYRIEHVRTGQTELLVRINRFTGRVTVLCGYGTCVGTVARRYSPDNPFAPRP